MTISHFHGEYRFLSNFYPAKVVLDGDEYITVEHAYVAAKTTSEFLRRQVRQLQAPGEAKKFGRQLTLRDGWDGMKLAVMEDLVRQKFQHPELRALLEATRPHELVEGNEWGDVFYGVCRGKGENHLGRILMRVRGDVLDQPDW